MHRNDIVAVLLMVVGISSLTTDAAFQSELSSLFGSAAPKVLAVLGIVGTVGSQIIRILSVPTQTKGTS